MERTKKHGDFFFLLLLVLFWGVMRMRGFGIGIRSDLVHFAVFQAREERTSLCIGIGKVQFLHSTMRWQPATRL